MRSGRLLVRFLRGLSPTRCDWVPSTGLSGFGDASVGPTRGGSSIIVESSPQCQKPQCLKMTDEQLRARSILVGSRAIFSAR